MSAGERVTLCFDSSGKVSVVPPDGHGKPNEPWSRHEEYAPAHLLDEAIELLYRTATAEDPEEYADDVGRWLDAHGRKVKP